MASTSVNEKTGFTMQISFLDGDGLPVPVATARWRAYCATTNTNLTDWTALTVDSTGRADLFIPSTITTIIRDSNPYEEKILATEANEGTDQQVSNDHSIVVKNLKVTE